MIMISNRSPLLQLHSQSVHKALIGYTYLYFIPEMLLKEKKILKSSRKQKPSPYFFMILFPSSVYKKSEVVTDSVLNWQGNHCTGLIRYSTTDRVLYLKLVTLVTIDKLIWDYLTPPRWIKIASSSLSVSVCNTRAGHRVSHSPSYQKAVVKV